MNKGLKSIFVLLILVSSGCTGAVEEVTDIVDNIDDIPIDNVINPISEVLDWMDIGSRERVSPELVPYNSCDYLENDIRENLKERMRITILQQTSNYYGGGMWIEDDFGMEMDGVAEDTGAVSDSSATGSNSDTREEGVDFSGTNNQEEGVDESDFVKTDGNYIYMINNGKLVILGVPEFGSLDFQSVTSIEGNAQEMMLAEDKLVVLSSVYSWSLSEEDPLWNLVWDDIALRMRVSSLTKFTVFDISERNEPTLINELYLEGWYLTAREQNGMVRTITHGYLDLPGLKSWVEISPEHQDSYYNLDWDNPARQVIWNLSINHTIENNNEVIDDASIEDLMPQMYHRTTNGVSKVPMRSETCSEFIATKDNVGTQFTSILTLDLLSASFSYEADHLMGNWPVVYASQDTLVIAEPAQDWWWYWGADEIEEATNIHAFSLTSEGTSYLGSGRVDGTVLDQFSLSEYEGNIRLATTTGEWNRWWMADPDPMENHVIILQPNSTTSSLNEIGRIDGIAPDERIWSARFVEDRAYIVTFRQIDPLWTIDLSDPTNPEIMGELEVPGVSTYIHPLDENNVLTIGIGPADLETGLGLDWSNTQVSMFDVSNFTSPELASVLSLSPVSSEDSNEWTWGWSEATYEHKAFQYWGPKNMLAIPLSTHRSIYVENTNLEEKEEWCNDRVEYMTWLLMSEESIDEEAETTESETGSEGSTGASKQTQSDPPPPSDGEGSEPDEDSDDSGGSDLSDEDREYLVNYCMENYHYGGYWKYEYISQLILVNVESGVPLSVYGTVNHSHFYNEDDCQYCYWYGGQTNIKRSIFMGDYIYAISSGGITVTNLTSMENSDEVEFSDYIENENNSNSNDENDTVVVIEGENG
ncbi:MAG: hypothetical protein CMA34_00160 [Euryarchaeota archaeon]|nr:hypothetical protein [Euryarchaeota archaeon]